MTRRIVLGLAMFLAAITAPTPVRGQDPFTVHWPAIAQSAPGQRWNLVVSTVGVQWCGGAPGQTVIAANPYPHSIYIRGVKVWNGVGKHATVDMWTRIWVAGGIYVQPMVIFSHNWDRYGPTSWHEPFSDDAGDGYYELVQGGWLTFNATCSPIEPQAMTLWNNETQFQVRFETTRPFRR